MPFLKVDFAACRPLVGKFKKLGQICPGYATIQTASPSNRGDAERCSSRESKMPNVAAAQIMSFDPRNAAFRHYIQVMVSTMCVEIAFHSFSWSRFDGRI